MLIILVSFADLQTGDIEATGRNDYQELAGFDVSFPSGIASRTITINIYDDQELEPTEKFTVFLSSFNSIDLGQRAVSVNILDDDRKDLAFI